MRNRFVHARAAVLVALALAACAPTADDADDAGAAGARAQVLSTVPSLVNSELRDTTGAEDAERRTYVARFPLDSAAAFYRRILPGMGWQAVGDYTRAGAIDLHYRKGETALWVRLSRVEADLTEYTLIGTSGPPTAPADTARPRR